MISQFCNIQSHMNGVIIIHQIKPGNTFQDMLNLFYILYQNSHIDGLLQKSHNSRALAMELCLTCTKPIDIVLLFT